jgi:hypothetical protein
MSGNEKSESEEEIIIKDSLKDKKKSWNINKQPIQVSESLYDSTKYKKKPDKNQNQRNSLPINKHKMIDTEKKNLQNINRPVVSYEENFYEDFSIYENEDEEIRHIPKPISSNTEKNNVKLHDFKYNSKTSQSNFTTNQNLHMPDHLASRLVEEILQNKLK